MNRAEFLREVASNLGRTFPTLRTRDDDKVQARPFGPDDIHLGAVAAEERGRPPNELRVQLVAVEGRDGGAGAEWERLGDGAIPGPYPDGLTLRYVQGGEKHVNHMVRFSWPNPDPLGYRQQLLLVEQCIDFFIARGRAGQVPGVPALPRRGTQPGRL